MKNKPQFIKIVTGALMLVYVHRSILLKALLFPFLMLLALDAVSYSVASSYMTWLLYIPELAVYTVFAIIIHRVILLGPESVPKWGIRFWSLRELYFLFHLIAITIVSMAFMFTSIFIPYVGIVPGLIITFYLFIRLSLVFPASAIDHGVTFKTSWTLTKKHQLLMLYIIIIAPILFGIPTLLAGLITDAYWITSVIDMFVTVYVVSSLSLAYGEILKFENTANNQLNQTGAEDAPAG